MKFFFNTEVKIASSNVGTTRLQTLYLNRHFYRLSSEPSLWANTQPTREVLEREGLSTFLLLPRFSLLKELDLSYIDLTREATETISNLPSRLLSKWSCYLYLLLILRFNSLRFRYTILSATQRSALIKSCGSKKAQVGYHLRFCHVDYQC